MRVRFANGQVARRIATAVTEYGFSPTLVHVEHLPLVDIGLRLAKLYGCAVVYRAHNIESQLWARRLGRPSLLRRAVIRRMDDMEADAMNACAATLCISDVDLAWARAHAPAAAVELLPCSLLLDRYDSVRSEHDTAEPRICFVGGLEWGPNEVGLRWFVQEVLPLVVQQVPQATLAVLARGATERPWLTDNPAVRVVPQESKAVSLFASSSVSVAPLLQGGGVRIKIPESLAVGCPVVATTIGGEGLDLPGLTRTDDPAEFARACVHHLRQARTSESRAMLRDAVNANHGATVLAERLIDTWRRIARAGYRPNSPLVEV
jgi:glycosyltransferase involved in cell wall biosynthesis